MTLSETAFWHRLDVPGTDAASVWKTGTGFCLLGQSTFLDARGPAALRYELHLHEDWTTRSGQISGFIGGTKIDTVILRSPEGWTFNDHPLEMPDILDLDLGFTPATNMLQLKRVNANIGERVQFDVAWMEAGDQELVRLPQIYKRVSEFNYEYESPSAGYSGTIVLAPSGFAAEYPSLWHMPSTNL